MSARSGILRALGIVGWDHLEPVIVAALVTESPLLLIGPQGSAKTIVLTRRGHDALAAGRRIFADIEQRWIEEFGEERIAQVRETAEMLVEYERGALPA